MSEELRKLIAGFRGMANEYDTEYQDANRALQYVIAAQKGGIACGLRIAANQLEASVEQPCTCSQDAVWCKVHGVGREGSKG